MGGGKPLDGLWTVVFSTGADSSGGVIVFTDGQLRGGDSCYFYVGEYSVDDNRRLTSNVTAYAFSDKASTVFGVPLRRFDLQIAGSFVTSDSVEAEATVTSVPKVRLRMRLTRRV